jgi:transaldolase
MYLIANILRMYAHSDRHVEVLTASVRTFDHFQYALRLGSDIITAPYGILKEWGEKGLPLPGNDYTYAAGELKAIPYRELDLTRNWHDFGISHDLTVKGMERFSADWNSDRMGPGNALERFVETYLSLFRVGRSEILNNLF